jgi:trimeric autotransporter adhesin
MTKAGIRKILAQRSFSMIRSGVLFALALSAFAQPSQYSIRTIAGVVPIGDNGQASRALLHFPVSVAVDAAGNVWIADEPGNRVRRVNTDGTITTVLGNGIGGFSGDGGPAAAAQTNGPRAIKIDAAGNVYVGEFFGYRIRRISPAGIVTTVVGSGVRGFSGEGGQAVNAQIGEVNDIALLPNNILVFSDASNHMLRQVNLTTGIITRFAGTGASGFGGDEGPALDAQFNNPHGLAVDAQGRLFVADAGNCRIRVIHQGVIRNVAGSSCGYRDAPDPNNAQFFVPRGIAFDPSQPNDLYVADQLNNRIRRVVLPSANVSTVVGNGNQSFSGDNAALPTVAFNWPFGVALDRNGNLLIRHAECARPALFGQCGDDLRRRFPRHGQRRTSRGSPALLPPRPGLRGRRKPLPH